MRRPLVSTLLPVAVILIVAFSALHAFAGTSPDAGNDFQQRINVERANAGLPALSFDAELLDVANRHSAEMASAGNIYHNSNLPNEVHGWLELGENVGRGPSVAEIHQAFMESPTHKEQIMNPRYAGFAVGVVTTDSGELFVTELFILREAPAAPVPVKLATARVRRQRTAQAAPSAPVAAEEPVIEEPVVPVPDLAAAITSDTSGPGSAPTLEMVNEDSNQTPAKNGSALPPSAAALALVTILTTFVVKPSAVSLG